MPKTDLRSVERAVIVYMKLEASDLRLFVHMNTFWLDDSDDRLWTAQEFENIASGFARGRWPGAKTLLGSRSLDSEKFFPYETVTGRRTTDIDRKVLATFEVEEFDLDTDDNRKKYEELFEENLEHVIAPIEENW